ncbi:MAG TPA: phosphoadenylyl-sulfate reductase [Acidimicrobiia bacterium]|nr:phosphoadenylyl-sulfate reductase [Acidimicrobiia bacterium]
MTATEGLTRLPDLSELAEASRRLETAPASAAVAWAHERFGDGIVLAASFQDCVLIDVAINAVADIPVVFLDTEYHFAETLWYVEQVRRRYGLNLEVMKPKAALDDLWHADPDACCAIRKVEPLGRALDGKAAWLSGLRRAETPTRAKAPIVSWDVGRGLVKVNPLASWTDADVAGYVAEKDLPVHPLAGRGYASIGCWPCTRAVGDGESARAGRWSGTDKIECGLH